MAMGTGFVPSEKAAQGVTCHPKMMLDPSREWFVRDTPGVSVFHSDGDAAAKAAAAVSLTRALREDQDAIIVFVLTTMSGRVKNDDVFLIHKVLYAVGTICLNRYIIVINQ
eukprot:3938334-Rhodomonas_salina.1